MPGEPAAEPKIVEIADDEIPASSDSQAPPRADGQQRNATASEVDEEDKEISRLRLEAHLPHDGLASDLDLSGSSFGTIPPSRSSDRKPWLVRLGDGTATDPTTRQIGLGAGAMAALGDGDALEMPVDLKAQRDEKCTELVGEKDDAEDADPGGHLDEDFDLLAVTNKLSSQTSRPQSGAVVGGSGGFGGAGGPDVEFDAGAYLLDDADTDAVGLGLAADQKGGRGAGDQKTNGRSSKGDKGGGGPGYRSGSEFDLDSMLPTRGNRVTGIELDMDPSLHFKPDKPSDSASAESKGIVFGFGAGSDSGYSVIAASSAGLGSGSDTPGAALEVEDEGVVRSSPFATLTPTQLASIAIARRPLAEPAHSGHFGFCLHDMESVD